MVRGSVGRRSVGGGDVFESRIVERFLRVGVGFVLVDHWRKLEQKKGQ